MQRMGYVALVCAALALVLTACGGDEVDRDPVTPDAPPTEAGETEPAEARPDLTTPRGSIAHQRELLMAGDVDALRACFTPRQQGRITEESVAEGMKEVHAMTMDALFASVEEGEYQGQKTAKVKMKNGRTLTTLVLTDGVWLADTVWFR